MIISNNINITILLIIVTVSTFKISNIIITNIITISSSIIVNAQRLPNLMLYNIPDFSEN